MLRKLYKLTDQNMCTYNNTQWVLGEWIVTDGEQDKLCTNSWLHAYEDPYIATLFNSIHGNFTNPRLFEAEGDGEFLDDYGMKCGVTKLRLVKEIPLPVITDEQIITILLRFAVSKTKYQPCINWANDWLSGKDRSLASICNILDMVNRRKIQKNDSWHMYFILKYVRSCYANNIDSIFWDEDYISSLTVCFMNYDKSEICEIIRTVLGATNE